MLMLLLPVAILAALLLAAALHSRPPSGVMPAASGLRRQQGRGGGRAPWSTLKSPRMHGTTLPHTRKHQTGASRAQGR